MELTLKLKPDAARTAERFEAWWTGELVDRPPVNLWMSSGKPYRGPVSAHRTHRERWLDAQFTVESAVARLECGNYIADNLPVFFPNVGPEITATLYGCELEFSEGTSWSAPVVRSPDEWAAFAARPPDFANPYWRTIERMTDLAIEACDGRYLVGLTDLHGAYDILAALRDPQALCLDLMDDPAAVDRAARHAAAGFVEAFARNYRRVRAAGFGSTTWTPVYHDGPAYLPSCDFWCMVSPAMARDLVLPTLEAEMAPLARSLFHLDGPNALPHLDLLLAMPGLQAIQWVYGAGAGPAARWLDAYRRIRAAGKSIQVFAEGFADALAVLDAVGPAGVWLCVPAGDATEADAQAFLRELERRAARSVRAGR